MATDIPTSIDDLKLSLSGYDITQAKTRIVDNFGYDQSYMYTKAYFSITGTYAGPSYHDCGKLPAPLIIAINRADNTPLYREILNDPYELAPGPLRLAHDTSIHGFHSPLEGTGFTCRVDSADYIAIGDRGVSDRWTVWGEPTSELVHNVAAEILACGCRIDVIDSIGFASITDEGQKGYSLLAHGSISACDMEEGRSRYASYGGEQTHTICRPAIELVDSDRFILFRDEMDPIEAIADFDKNEPLMPIKWTIGMTFLDEDLPGDPAFAEIIFQDSPDEYA